MTSFGSPSISALPSRASMGPLHIVRCAGAGHCAESKHHLGFRLHHGSIAPGEALSRLGRSMRSRP